MECYTREIQSHKEEAQTVISTTHESLTKISCIYFVIPKTDMFSKIIHDPMGSNPHLIKRYKFIDKTISRPPTDQ